MAQLQARFVRILETKEGTSKKGDPYKFLMFLVSTEGQYPKNIALSCGIKAASYVEKLRTGQMVDFDYDLDSKEFNGKWYTSANVYRVNAQEGGQQYPQAPESQRGSQASASNDEDQLPF